MKKMICINIKFILQTICFFLIQFNYFGRKISWYSEVKVLFVTIIFAIFLIQGLIIIKKKKIKEKTIFILLLSVLLGIISFVSTDDPLFLYIPIIGIFYIDNSFENSIKSDLIAKLLIIFVVVGCNMTGSIISKSFYREGVIRETFGFHHPNAFGYILTAIYADIVILRRHIKKPALGILIGVLLLSIISLSDSRTSMLIMISLLVVEISKYRNFILKEKGNRLIAQIPVFLAFFSLIATYIYNTNNSFLLYLDQQFSNRISLQSYYENHVPIMLFGQQLVMTEYPLDNGYFHALYKFGIVGLAVILIIYISSIRKSVDRREPIIMRVLLLLSIFALMESNPIRILITPITLYFLTPEMRTEKKEN